MHLLIIDHLPFLQHLMTWKNSDTEQEFVIPVFFLTTPMAINLLSKSNEIYIEAQESPRPMNEDDDLGTMYSTNF